MIDDMDINCGDILDGVSIEEKGREIFEMVLRVASGERSKSEQLGYGDAEFVPWTVGATMVTPGKTPVSSVRSQRRTKGRRRSAICH